MSQALMQAYFERDLSLEEMDAIAAGLNADNGEAAAAFEALAIAANRKNGVPALKRKKGGLFMLGGLLIVTAAAWYLWPAETRTEAVPQPLAEPAAEAKPQRHVAIPKPQVRVVSEGGHLAIEVKLAASKQLLVEMLDKQGRLVKRVGEGRFDAGTRRFGWSGKDEAGRPAPTGAYIVSVDYGADTIEKKVYITEHE